jgi:hypothetical protein
MSMTASYVPSSAGGRIGVGQVQQFGLMIQKAGKNQLKRGQLLQMLQKKKLSSAEFAIQQFGLAESYLIGVRFEERHRDERAAPCEVYTHIIQAYLDQGNLSPTFEIPSFPWSSHSPTWFLPSSPVTSVSSSAAPVLNFDLSGSPLTFRSALAGPFHLQWMQGK